MNPSFPADVVGAGPAGLAAAMTLTRNATNGLLTATSLGSITTALGFPQGGHWREVFNSDVYDNWVNPAAVGNGAGVDANGPGMHGLPASALVAIPANGVLIFTS